MRYATLRFFVPAVLLLLSWGVLSFGAVYPWGYMPILVGCIELGLYGLFKGGAFHGVSEFVPCACPTGVTHSFNFPKHLLSPLTCCLRHGLRLHCVHSSQAPYFGLIELNDS